MNFNTVLCGAIFLFLNEYVPFCVYFSNNMIKVIFIIR